MKNLITILLSLYFLISNLFADDSLIFIIRVDDIQSRNTTTLPRTIKDFQNAVESRGGKISWLVIPHRLIESQNNDGSLIKDLKETINNRHEIGLHGYNHICPICSSTNHEMFCSSQNLSIGYSLTSQLIQNGKKLLKDSLGVTPTIFVPPGHQQDTNTFKVLLENNINFISSLGGTKKFLYGNLFNLQQNNEFTWSLTSSNYNSQLKAALNDIKNTGKINGYYCILLHDPFIRKGYENGIVIKWMSELLDSLNIFYGNKIKYQTLSQASEYFKNLVTNINDIPYTPKDYFLSKNYPNPFNPTTTIEYYIPENSTVNIQIYNVIGECITTLVDKMQSTGHYKLTWNAEGLNSGIYFLRMNTGKYISTIKMILMK